MNDETRNIAVVGGGVVGISTALFLQRAGFAVTLIDPEEPGSQTSFGNAGIICGGHYLPATMPRAPLELLNLALNRATYASYRLPAVPGFLRWLAAFWAEGEPGRLGRTAHAATPIMQQTVKLHRQLLGEAGRADLIRDTGFLQVLRSETDFAALETEIAFAREAGVSFDVMDAREACELEPAIRPVFARAIHWHDNASVSDPFAVSQAYLGLFCAAGGTVRQAKVQAIAPGAGQGWQVHAGGEDLAFSQVVVSAGVWSRDLLAPLGYDVPLKPKRGYHRHFSAQGNAGLSRPVVDDAIGYVLAPMAGGIRMTSGIELAGRDAPITERMVSRIEPYARELFPLDKSLDAEPWMGRRPAFPDSLPVVGAAPRHEGLWVNFGHAHLGLTMGPATGLLLSQMVSGEKPMIDSARFAPGRYL
ncbi:NAD(P)/FAD-dependent oxidoreductase [Tepidamorphus sp. 3E244]|uniref:NAD(P)/FAD-dependent oxidoreductase n=1 Tax=Tepidamorphus sp. 3E244 TaxID=3385498 RepID=UPI0038FC8924